MNLWQSVLVYGVVFAGLTLGAYRLLDWSTAKWWDR